MRRNLSLTTARLPPGPHEHASTDPNDPTRILQTGSQRTNGYEVGLNGFVTSKWSVAGGYAYQDAFISSATVSAVKGAQVALVPHHTFSLVEQLPECIRGSDSGSDSFIVQTCLPRSITPSFCRDTHARTRPCSSRSPKSWRLQANFQNLFDNTYYLNADGNNNISPGAPRGARLALIARF